MPDIENILRLPKEEQVAIMEAIQEHLEEDVMDNHELNDEQLDFLRRRIEDIDGGSHKLYQWNEVKQALANKWNTL